MKKITSMIILLSFLGGFSLYAQGEPANGNCGIRGIGVGTHYVRSDSNTSKSREKFMQKKKSKQADSLHQYRWRKKE